MKISKTFQSKYIKADDLQGRRVVVQIMSVTLEEISDTERKPVMRFAGREKGMVLNRTNATACAQMFGDDTMTWSGQQVELLAMPTHFQGKQVLGLVTLPISSAPAQPQFDDQSQFQQPGPHDGGSKIIQPHATQPRQVGGLAQSEAGPGPQDHDEIPL